MRDNVLVRKKAGIILMLAKALKVTPERALGLFYPTDTNRMLSDKRFGLQLMSNRSIVRDVLAELGEGNRLIGRACRSATAAIVPQRKGALGCDCISTGEAAAKRSLEWCGEGTRRPTRA